MKKYVNVDDLYVCQTCANHATGVCKPYPPILETINEKMNGTITDYIVQCDNGSRYRPDYTKLNVVEGVLIPNPFAKK